MKISVIMAAYNTERYIEQAIKSILKQSFNDFEIIVVDDASTDKTAEVIAKLAKEDSRIKLIRNKKNLGLTKNLNIALKKAKGEYIARMDADDVALPQRFAKQVTFLDKHKEIALVGTWADIINNKNKRVGEIKYATNDAQIRKNLIGRSQFIHPSVMFRKSVIKKVGLYDESFRSAQDYEYFPRMMTKFKAANMPEKLMRYRWDFSQNEGFTSGKRQEKNALRARWYMLTRYGWPKWQFIYLIKPAVSFLVPMKLKRVILKRLSASAL